MSIFDSLFGHKKEEQKENKVNLTKQIDTLVLVIENLGLLNKEKIIEKLDKLPVEYDKNLIKRLSISEDKEKLSALYKYLEKDNLSFGKESINSLRKQLEFISSNNSLTQDNMIEEMLNVTEKYINKYKSIIEELNNSIKTFEMAKPTYADKIAMIDSFTKLYKENELGYPINLEEKVEDRQRSLKNLKYGGYGEEELKSFISRCKNTITDKKNKGWTTKEILDFIDENIYTPLLSRYNQDLEQLEIRISRLQSGEYKENERKRKQEEIILDFNEHYGHNITPEIFREKYKNELLVIDNVGYPKDAIKEFEEEIDDIITRATIKGQTNISTVVDIKNVFDKYVIKYSKAKDTLERNIRKVERTILSNEEKERRKEALQENFKLTLSAKKLSERLEIMLNTLKKLNFSSIEISSFKKSCEDKITNASLSTDMLEDLNELFEEKLTSTEENLENYIEILIANLKTLPSGGYGENAISEFRKETDKVLETKLLNKDKKEKIKTIYERYKNNYLTNKEIFTKWKEERIKSYSGTDLENYVLELDNEISYMLSLSTSELNDYYEEDDKKKREAGEKHNLMVILKSLAKDEYQKTNNKRLYEKRLKDITNGKLPYSPEKVAEKKEQLETLALFSEEDIPEDERIYSTIDYIDSTLYKQISSIDGVIPKK
ncbi:MAG: hypothetical protein PUG33_04095 [Mollicutes bacterium]|nr:hypothetical protein [Mollicutes bacterium]